jgi:hypothetical protein
LIRLRRSASLATPHTNARQHITQSVCAARAGYPVHGCM